MTLVFASEAFLNLLKVKGNGVNAYLSPSGKHSKTKCILFILKENKEAVLFSENDFLLLFLTKKGAKKMCGEATNLFNTLRVICIHPTNRKLPGL